MIKPLALLLVTSCALSTSTTEQEYCTIEDQNAGTCELVVARRTRDTAVDVDPAASGSPVYCAAYSDGRKYCTLSIDLPGHLLVVTCWETTDGDVDCTWFFG